MTRQRNESSPTRAEDARDELLTVTQHSRSCYELLATGSRIATHSTWCVIEKMSHNRTITKPQVRPHFRPHPPTQNPLERQTSVSRYVIKPFRTRLLLGPHVDLDRRGNKREDSPLRPAATCALHAVGPPDSRPPKWRGSRLPLIVESGNQSPAPTDYATRGRWPSMLFHASSTASWAPCWRCA